MQSPVFSIAELTSPGFIKCSPDELWPSIIAANQTQLLWAIRKQKYRSFLRSPYWYAVATKVKERAGHRCQLCNAGGVMHVHHRTYENHGKEHEAFADLLCLCEYHHKRHHEDEGDIKKKPKKPREGRIPPGVIQGRASNILWLARQGKVQRIPNDKKAANKHIFAILESGRVAYEKMVERAKTVYYWADLVA